MSALSTRDPSEILRLAGRVSALMMFCAILAPMGCRKPRVSPPVAPGVQGPVHDLAAIRAADNLSLGWSMPKKRTRNLVVNGSISVHVCRRESAASPCTEVAEPMLLAPGAAGSFSEELPPALTSGPPRVLLYFVVLYDRNGRSTGLSNSVATLAGAPLPAVQDFAAAMTKDGVLLRCTPLTAADEPAGTIIRLHRVRILLTGPHPESPQPSTADVPDAVDRDLPAEDGLAGRALDTNIRTGDVYEYRVQRVVRATVGSQTLELAGQLSIPARVETENGTAPN